MCIPVHVYAVIRIRSYRCPARTQLHVREVVEAWCVLVWPLAFPPVDLYSTDMHPSDMHPTDVNATDMYGTDMYPHVVRIGGQLMWGSTLDGCHSIRTADGIADIKANEWTHVGFTLSGGIDTPGQATLYINGASALANTGWPQLLSCS